MPVIPPVNCTKEELLAESDNSQNLALLQSLTSGVPQGSVPLLFVVYNPDLEENVQGMLLLMLSKFADDSKVLVKIVIVVKNYLTLPPQNFSVSSSHD